MSPTLRRDLKSLCSNILFQDLDSSCISMHKLVSDGQLLLFHFPCIYSIASSLSINGATDGVYAFPCVSLKVSISCCQNAFLLSTIFILFEFLTKPSCLPSTICCHGLAFQVWSTSLNSLFFLAFLLFLSQATSSEMQSERPWPISDMTVPVIRSFVTMEFLTRFVIPINM